MLLFYVSGHSGGAPMSFDRGRRPKVNFGVLKCFLLLNSGCMRGKALVVPIASFFLIFFIQMIDMRGGVL